MLQFRSSYTQPSFTSHIVPTQFFSPSIVLLHAAVLSITFMVCPNSSVPSPLLLLPKFPCSHIPAALCPWTLLWVFSAQHPTGPWGSIPLRRGSGRTQRAYPPRGSFLQGHSPEDSSAQCWAQIFSCFNLPHCSLQGRQSYPLCIRRPATASVACGMQAHHGSNQHGFNVMRISFLSVWLNEMRDTTIEKVLKILVIERDRRFHKFETKFRIPWLQLIPWAIYTSVVSFPNEGGRVRLSLQRFFILLFFFYVTKVAFMNFSVSRK